MQQRPDLAAKALKPDYALGLMFTIKNALPARSTSSGMATYVEIYTVVQVTDARKR
jgi:hypothetical protein